MNDEIQLSDNTAAHRFELSWEGSVAAYAEYKLLDDSLVFTHTEVLPGSEGRGLGSKLAKFVLDEARRRGLKAVPECTFIAGYIRKHADYLDLVTPEHRRACQL